MTIEGTLPIDRLHRALRFLSIVAIVLVLVLAIAAAREYVVVEDYQLHVLVGKLLPIVPGFVVSGVGSFGLNIFPLAVVLLMSMLAWAEHRNRWLIIILVAECLALIGPAVYELWGDIRAFSGYYPQDHMAEALQVFVVDVAQVIPLTVAFAFSRQRRAPRGASEQAV